LTPVASGPPRLNFLLKPSGHRHRRHRLTVRNKWRRYSEMKLPFFAGLFDRFGAFGLDRRDHENRCCHFCIGVDHHRFRDLFGSRVDERVSAYSPGPCDTGHRPWAQTRLGSRKPRCVAPTPLRRKHDLTTTLARRTRERPSSIGFCSTGGSIGVVDILLM
jgi:hypothetical protein